MICCSKPNDFPPTGDFGGWLCFERLCLNKSAIFYHHSIVEIVSADRKVKILSYFMCLVIVVFWRPPHQNARFILLLLMMESGNFVSLWAVSADVMFGGRCHSSFKYQMKFYNRLIVHYATAFVIRRLREFLYL